MSDLLLPDVPAAFCLGIRKRKKKQKQKKSTAKNDNKKKSSSMGYKGTGYRVGLKKAFVKQELVLFQVQFKLFLLKVFCSGGKVHMKQIKAHAVVLSFVFVDLNCAYEKSSSSGHFLWFKVLFCFLHCWRSVIN